MEIDMGMYTYFIIKGTVKEKYREKVNLLYDDDFCKKNNYDFEKNVAELDFDLLKEFSKGFRSDMIFYGCRNCDDNFYEWDKETGNLHLEIDIKNYPEEGKPKNSMELFEDIIPELFEDGLFYSSQYEEYDVPWEGVLKNGKLVVTNYDEYSKQFESWNY